MSRSSLTVTPEGFPLLSKFKRTLNNALRQTDFYWYLIGSRILLDHCIPLCIFYLLLKASNWSLKSLKMCDKINATQRIKSGNPTGVLFGSLNSVGLRSTVCEMIAFAIMLSITRD